MSGFEIKLFSGENEINEIDNRNYLLKNRLINTQRL